MLSLLVLFGAVVVLNVLPAFAPPTWMLLSVFGVRFPDASPWMVRPRDRWRRVARRFRMSQTASLCLVHLIDWRRGRIENRPRWLT